MKLKVEIKFRSPKNTRTGSGIKPLFFFSVKERCSHWNFAEFNHCTKTRKFIQKKKKKILLCVWIINSSFCSVTMND